MNQKGLNVVFEFGNVFVRFESFFVYVQFVIDFYLDVVLIMCWIVVLLNNFIIFVGVVEVCVVVKIVLVLYGLGSEIWVGCCVIFIVDYEVGLWLVVVGVYCIVG